MMHEFEGLLFSDCRQFVESIGRVDVLDELQKIRDRFPSSEAINDSPETHPSQRIKDLIPEYQKPWYGNIAAIEIGLDTLARECSGFRDWLQKLTALHWSAGTETRFLSTYAETGLLGLLNRCARKAARPTFIMLGSVACCWGSPEFRVG